jgi:SAM-dependent methyltransferase
MPIFKKQKILFIHNPKTGGSSIEDYFYKKFNVQRTKDTLWMGWYFGHMGQHCTYIEIQKVFPDLDFIDYTILGAVRNPYHRMISELLYIRMINHNTPPQEVTKCIRKYLTNNFMYDNHKLEQYKYFIDADGTIPDQIIIMRQESLDVMMHGLGYDDFKIHSNTSGGIRNGPNVKNNVKKDYMSFYDIEGKKLVYDYYRIDFETFDYDPELFDSVDVPTPLSITDTSYQMVAVVDCDKQIYPTSDSEDEIVIRPPKSVPPITSPVKIVAKEKKKPEPITKKIIASSSIAPPGIDLNDPKMTNFAAAKKFVEVNRGKNRESLSGPGSHLANTQEAIAFINNVIDKYHVKTILDLGCGDFNWARFLKLDNVEYTGWDCDEQMIADNTLKYGTDNIRFQVRDIVTNDYPDVDLIICRDVLFHINLDFGQQIIAKVSKSCKYFISTTYKNVGVNTGPRGYNQISNWGFFTINLNLEPFNLKEKELESVHETKNSINNKQRYMVLYKFD